MILMHPFTIIPSAGRRFILSVLLIALSAVMALAQPGPGGRGMKIQASGQVVDSKTGDPLVGAAVKVTSADGGTGTFGICDSEGKFTFEINFPGKYTLEITYVSYKSLTKEVQIWPGRGKLGTFKLKEDPHVLAEVETIGHSERIKLKGDTLAYNADAYKVQDGATADELIAKMPGIEVTNDGVKAQGETVEKVLVDGKEFFQNDPKLALKSLPAEVVETVQVFDKKSDQAEFTGIDDGNTVKAMDLTTKSYRRNGIFGKVYGGGGADLDFGQGFWNAGFNLNVFSGSQRISLLGMSNNVNQTNFSFEDMAATGGMMRGGPGGWGSPSGVSRANALGVNYSNQFFDDKLDIQANYFFNQIRTQAEDSTFEDDLNRDLATISSGNSLSHSYTNRLEARISYKPSDNDEIMFRPNINIQNSNGNSFSDNATWNYKLDEVMASDTLRYRHSQATSQTYSDTESDSWNVRGSLLWRHRLHKAGRTLSVNIDAGASASESDADYQKQYSSLGVLGDKQYQRSDNETRSHNVGGNIQWTEPLTTNQQISFRYDVSYSQSRRESAIDYFTDERFDVLDHHDANNSSNYEQRNTRHIGELGWNIRKGTLRLNVNLKMQHSHLEGEQDFYLKTGDVAENFSTSKNYYSFLPNMRLEWRNQSGLQLHFNYRSSADNPSVSNLQQSVNTTNELRYSTGNPDLDQSITHRANLRMIYTNTETAQNFMVFGGFTYTMDPIGTQYLTNTSSQSVDIQSLGNGYEGATFQNLKLAPGARITRPVNTSAQKSANLALVYGFPFDLIWSNVNISVDGSYSATPSSRLYFNGAFDKDLAPVVEVQDTRVRNLSLSPRLHITSNISTDLNFGISYSPRFNWVDDPENETQSRDYFTHDLNANLNWTFWHGFTTEQSVNYMYYGGPSMIQSFNEWIWNASFGKKFLKGNKAEIKLQAYDILNGRKGYSLSVGDTSLSHSYVNIMPRYFLLTFTYKLSAYRGNGGSQESSRGGRGGHGGGPGGFGGPMPF